MHSYFARTAILTAISLLVLMTGIALSPVPGVLAACPEESTQDRNAAPPRNPQVAPPQPDINWPITSRHTDISIDETTRRPITTTITIRENPNPKPQVMDPNVSGVWFGPQVALAACTFNTQMSVQIDTGLGSPSVFTQHYKMYNDRYQYLSVYAYWNWRVDVWWTRTSTLYSLSSQSVSWSFAGYNCGGGVESTRTSTNTGWLPSWSSTYQTTIYADYDAYTWPIYWADICYGCGRINVAQSTTVLESGYYAGTLNQSYTYPVN